MPSLPVKLRLISTLVVLLGLVSSAEAKNESRSAREKAAKKACAMGDYQKGEDILTDLLVETNDAMFIYNQARCYEQNNLWDRAIARFHEYLRKAHRLTDAERAETEQHIAECETAKARATTPATTSPPPIEPPMKTEAAAPVMTPRPEPTPLVDSAPPVPAADESPEGETAGRGLRIAGVVTGVTGLAVIGAGVGFALKTQSISSNEDKNGATKSQEDERKRYEKWGWVCYGVGAAALATGVILYLVGWPSHGPSKVALLPSIGSTGAGLSLEGSF